MSLDATLVEQLLHEDESTSLDFKRDQYKFSGADNATKSELLKDILAFANSWRRTPAYILIGVSEIRGDRCDVIGVQEHLDDAQLQQFVNSKTQRPVTFSYRQISIDDQEVGLIEIPIQERPIYLQKGFGKLDKERVYVRRGSSTAEANPEEVARMGAALVVGSIPILELVWADIERRRVLGQICEIQSTLLDLLSASAIQQRLPRDSHLYPMRNRSYADELIRYVYESFFVTPIGLRLKNLGETVGSRVRFVGSLRKSTGVRLFPWSDRHEPPSIDSFSPTVPALVLAKDISPDVRKLEDRSELTIDFGDVRPGDDVWTDWPVLIGALADGTSCLDGELRGDNIPKPIPYILRISHLSHRRPMTMEDIATHIRS